MSELAANFRNAFFRLTDPAERIRTLKSLSLIHISEPTRPY